MAGVAKGASALLSYHPVSHYPFPIWRELMQSTLPPWELVPGVVLPFPEGWLISPSSDPLFTKNWAQEAASFTTTSYPLLTIDEHYWVITLIFKKYGILHLCLENYALFSVPPVFTTILYTYPLSYIIYLGEPSGNIISNYHGKFIHILMH